VYLARDLRITRYSSPDVGMPPYAFLRLPFFGAPLAGRLVLPFFGLPGPLLWRAAPLPELLRFRPSFPPFIAFLHGIANHYVSARCDLGPRACAPHATSMSELDAR
jgi:hypothetical protein